MNNPQHIVVVGMMGAGKSTLADGLAQHFGRPHRDSDDDVVARTGLTGRQYAAQHGVDALHRVEEQVLLDALSVLEPLVISAAAWVVEVPACVEAMRHHATVMWIDETTDVLLERLGGRDHRRAIQPAAYRALAVRREPMFRAVGQVRVGGEPSVGALRERAVAGLEQHWAGSPST